MSFTCHGGNTGEERTPHKNQHTKLTLEKKILPPLLARFELATFRSRVRRFTNKLSRLPQDSSIALCRGTVEQQVDDLKLCGCLHDRPTSLYAASLGADDVVAFGCSLRHRLPLHRLLSACYALVPRLGRVCGLSLSTPHGYSQLHRR